MGISHKQYRKAALAAWKSKEFSAAKSNLPLSTTLMKTLFYTLDEKLTEQGCDHTLKIVKGWCVETEVNFTDLNTWLEAIGGHCDCEALDNGEEAFSAAIGQQM